jgi:RNA polymerase sigma factor (sigma-70 family)
LSGTVETDAVVVLTEAQQALVEENIRLVYHVSKRYVGIAHEDYLDLVATLRYRLCAAIASFDPSRGFKISPFVLRSLEGEAKNYFRDKIWIVRPPRHLRENWPAGPTDGMSRDHQTIGGEDAARIASCAHPVPLEQPLTTLDGAETIADQVADPDVDVEAAVVAKLGSGPALRELFSWLRPEERYATLLMMKHQGFGRQKFSRRYGITTHQAALVWDELRAKLRRAWFAILDGEELPANEGSEVLAQVRARQAGRAARSDAPPCSDGSPKTVCKRGHAMTPENTYITPASGWRVCRTCKNADKVRRTAARRAAVLVQKQSGSPEPG